MMIEHSNHRPSVRWGYLGILLVLIGAACSREAASPRAIRAHTRVLGGVSHANPADKPSRYCQGCHGATLAGGDTRFSALTTEASPPPPSCYTCHGKKWTNDDATADATPPTHSVSMAWPGEAASAGLDDTTHLAFHHHPDLFNPDAACTSCHGGSLAGDDPASGGTRSGCDLCHGELWLDRSPASNLVP